MINIKKQKMTLKIGLACLLIFALLFQFSNSGIMGMNTDKEQNSEIKLYSTAGIVINDTNIVSYSSSGTGVANDPYIIDNLMINTTDSLAVDFKGVSSTSYYVLRDSHLIGSTYGVYFHDSMTGKASVINCTVEGALSIGGPNALYLTIHNNTLKARQSSNFREGVKFTNNVVYLTSDYSSSIFLVRDENNIVEDNIFYGNASSIRINRVTNTTFRNNILYSSGFYFSDDEIEYILNNTFENNIINGKPFGFLYNQNDETITDDQYGQIYLVNSTNVLIENHSFSDVYSGIQIYNCTDISVRNVEVKANTGIYAENVEEILIEDSSFEGYRDGMQFEGVNNIIIQNNYITDFEYGLECNYMNNVQINNNTIVNMKEYGFYIADVSNVDINFNIITCLMLDEGSEVPILIWSSENITVFYNVFISTGNQTAHMAEEWSTTNIMWYDATSEIGNFWSNWNKTGTYAIEGDGGNVDLYPFLDIDGDNLTEIEEVLIYFTDPFTADSDGDGFSDYEEIQAGTDPLDSKDYPGRGRVLGIVLGLVFGLGIAAGVAVFFLSKKGIIKLPNLRGK